MALVSFLFIWIMSILGIFLFGFLIGRCARKLPLVDGTLPWTLHWGEIIPSCDSDHGTRSKTPVARPWPQDPHQGDEASP